MNQAISNLLKQFNLRTTDCRTEVLSLFLSKDFALSNADIETHVHQDFDRVTVYRTLKTFLGKGLIHKVLDDSGILKYALCKDECTEQAHHHQHVHFKCNLCGQTNCLENVQIPAISLPLGYQFVESNLLINGICLHCNHSKANS